ncbi:TPA: hypothetical protein HA235_02000 [Candidatus Woesearchaeota archaeon]|nr:hypothetical protein [Candidatus Woesearchaeota archaeon]HIH54238.1 hypothetical protein [Candidatus Woesearchaeota archaeon]HIJ02625.1 hypothetical protein [Candidatus Woesearchaeota archaeon]HIJ14555.1 hypothetical protein [Candidatus Woesearchaeota archaeon]
MSRKKKEHTVKEIKKPRKSEKNIDPEKYFVLCNGEKIKSLNELASTLETMSDDVFFYHVTNDRNDFANWINDVFQDFDLAESVRKTKNRFEIVAALYKNLYNSVKH